MWLFAVWLGVSALLVCVWALFAASSRLEERDRLSEAALRSLLQGDEDDPDPDPALRRDEERRDVPPRVRRRTRDWDDVSGVGGFDYPPPEDDR